MGCNDITWDHILKDSIHIWYCENLKSLTGVNVSVFLQCHCLPRHIKRHAEEFKV